VLVIEEAHDLTTMMFKHLKRFWEMEKGFTKLLGIILIGQPELKAKLDARINFEAREFINRCEVFELSPLGPDLEAYIEFKLKRVGVRPRGSSRRTPTTRSARASRAAQRPPGEPALPALRAHPRHQGDEPLRAHRRAEGELPR
jgi:type II secretory pathway predicted ATPase ExeA